jgi:hypothetical protein
VWVLWEAGHDTSVIHAPAVFAGEVLAEIAPSQACCWPKLLVACGVLIDVMNAEQKGVACGPGKA